MIIQNVTQAPDSEIAESIRVKMHEKDGRLAGLDREDLETVGPRRRFVDIIDDIDLAKMTDQEHQIMEDCNNTAFYQVTWNIEFNNVPLAIHHSICCNFYNFS